MQACDIGTCDVGRIESANRISGQCFWGLEQVKPTNHPFLTFYLFIFAIKSISIFNRRKGIIVGNDQDGDDSVITALVSKSYPFFTTFYEISNI